jgi:hypothetical protein
MGDKSRIKLRAKKYKFIKRNQMNCEDNINERFNINLKVLF